MFSPYLYINLVKEWQVKLIQMVSSTSSGRKSKNTIWSKIHFRIFGIWQLNRDVNFVDPLSPLDLRMTTAFKNMKIR